MNILKGTILEFTEAVFTGKYPNATYSHDAKHTVEVVNESYGAKKGQHTFTLKVLTSTDRPKGELFRKKGRNLYSTGRIIKEPENAEQLAREKRERAKRVKQGMNESCNNCGRRMSNYDLFQGIEYCKNCI